MEVAAEVSSALTTLLSKVVTNMPEDIIHLCTRTEKNKAGGVEEWKRQQHGKDIETSEEEEEADWEEEKDEEDEKNGHHPHTAAGTEETYTKDDVKKVEKTLTANALPPHTTGSSRGEKSEPVPSPPHSSTEAASPPGGVASSLLALPAMEYDFTPLPRLLPLIVKKLEQLLYENGKASLWLDEWSREVEDGWNGTPLSDKGTNSVKPCREEEEGITGNSS